MLLQAEMTETSFPGIPGSGDVVLYISFRDLLVSEDSQKAWIRIHVKAQDPDSYPNAEDVPSSIFPSKYEITNWTAINNAMGGSSSMWSTLQTYIEGRILAVDAGATITDLEA